MENLIETLIDEFATLTTDEKKELIEQLKQI